MANSQVCIISNPYLVSVDGLPNLDFLYHDLRKNVSNSNSTAPNDLKKQRRENNVRRLSKKQLSEHYNKLG